MLRPLRFLDTVGSAGALLAALAAPCCFPLFAVFSVTLGLAALGPYEQGVLYVLKASALLSLAGLALTWRRHRRVAPLVVGVSAVALLAYAFYVASSSVMLYLGLAGLLIASGWNWHLSRSGRAPILQSIITCPNCGHRAKETMPTDACLFFYDCPACRQRLQPKSGDCCVFCSYGSVPCPPIQIGSACCA